MPSVVCFRGKHAFNLDAVVNGPIEDQVVREIPNGPKAHIVVRWISKRSRSADERILGEQTKRFVRLRSKLESTVDGVILTDVNEVIDEIELSRLTT